MVHDGCFVRACVVGPLLGGNLSIFGLCRCAIDSESFHSTD